MSTEITNPQENNWDMIIQPQRSLLDLRLGELWRYKDLVLLFVRRDFVAVYKQTIPGPLWYLIQSLLTMITLFIVVVPYPVLHLKQEGEMTSASMRNLLKGVVQRRSVLVGRQFSSAGQQPVQLVMKWLGQLYLFWVDGNGDSSCALCS